MQEFELSSHAIEQMQIRGVPEEIVFEVLANPDKINIESDGQLIYQKIVLFYETKKYLVFEKL